MIAAECCRRIHEHQPNPRSATWDWPRHQSAAPAAEKRAGAFVWFIRADCQIANETSNLAAGRGQPVAMPGPARPAHRIQSVRVCLVTTRQKLDCVLRSVPPLLLRDFGSREGYGLTYTSCQESRKSCGLSPSRR